MRTILFLRFMETKKLLILRLFVIFLSFYGHSQNQLTGNDGFLYGMLGLGAISKQLEYTLPLKRRDKFLASFVESLLVIAGMVFITPVVARLFGDPSVFENVLFTSVVAIAIYNLVLTLPPTTTMRLGIKYLWVLFAFISFILIVVFLKKPYIVILVWFCIFYSVNYVFYEKLGHERRVIA